MEGAPRQGPRALLPPLFPSDEWTWGLGFLWGPWAPQWDGTLGLPVPRGLAGKGPWKPYSAEWGIVAAAAWGRGHQERAAFARGLTGEEGSRPVPSLWQGMKDSLTKSLMSPITLWYFPPCLPTSTLPPSPARS